MPNTLYTYPEVEITGEIYNRATLIQHVNSYEKLHGTTPYCLISGYMEKKDETLLYWSKNCSFDSQFEKSFSELE